MWNVGSRLWSREMRKEQPAVTSRSFNEPAFTYRVSKSVASTAKRQYNSEWRDLRTQLDSPPYSAYKKRKLF
jgi:hypothetical protein